MGLAWQPTEGHPGFTQGRFTQTDLTDTFSTYRGIKPNRSICFFLVFKWVNRFRFQPLSKKNFLFVVPPFDSPASNPKISFLHYDFLTILPRQAGFE